MAKMLAMKANMRLKMRVQVGGNSCDVRSWPASVNLES